ncbi:MAG: glycosyltransferase family 2 protein [Ghiorsea sp.]
MNIDIAAVVVTFRSKLLIDQCLKSVVDEGVSEIWVVDNASDDGTADYVQANYPNVYLIQNEENLGFSAANNQALRQTKARKILLLNPDAWLAPQALTEMISVMESDKEIAVVGPSIERQGNLEPSLLLKPNFYDSWHFLLSGMRAESTGGFAGKEAKGFPWQSVTDGDHVRGSCMLVRNIAVEQVGLLDELFFLYFEETEWCLRFRNQGWRVVIAPSAKAFHIGKASVKTQDSLPSLEFIRSAILFWGKTRSFPAQFVLRATLIVMAVVKCLLMLPFPNTKPRRSWLLDIAKLGINPFNLPIVYDKARSPILWGKS